MWASIHYSRPFHHMDDNIKSLYANVMCLSVSTRPCILSQLQLFYIPLTQSEFAQKFSSLRQKCKTWTVVHYLTFFAELSAKVLPEYWRERRTYSNEENVRLQTWLSPLTSGISLNSAITTEKKSMKETVKSNGFVKISWLSPICWRMWK